MHSLLNRGNIGNFMHSLLNRRNLGNFKEPFLKDQTFICLDYLNYSIFLSINNLKILVRNIEMNFKKHNYFSSIYHYFFHKNIIFIFLN